MIVFAGALLLGAAGFAIERASTGAEPAQS
jgi:hypothetical protein